MIESEIFLLSVLSRTYIAFGSYMYGNGDLRGSVWREERT